MIIKFYTEGCQPCKAVSRMLDQNEIIYEEIDIGKAIDSAIQYKVRSVPTVINTDTGATLVGFNGMLKTQEWIDDNCS
tara:strand:+ start:339 stop:572 length:234 start_codon:yes stop_codon:yes gene_type:complete